MRRDVTRPRRDAARSDVTRRDVTWRDATWRDATWCDVTRCHMMINWRRDRLAGYQRTTRRAINILCNEMRYQHAMWRDKLSKCYVTRCSILFWCVEMYHQQIMWRDAPSKCHVWWDVLSTLDVLPTWCDEMCYRHVMWGDVISTCDATRCATYDVSRCAVGIWGHHSLNYTVYVMASTM